MRILDVLIEYVTNSESINNSLRHGFNYPEMKILDGLFHEGNVPRYLYRLLDKNNLVIENDNIILDAAYLSCSSHFDDFINGIGAVSHMACLRIEDASPINRIIVNDLLPNQNDEGEIILPRNLRLQITSVENFNGVDDFMRLLEIVECDSTGPEELYYVMGIEEITLYSLSVVR